MDLLISLDIKLKIRTIIKLDLLSKKTLKGANMHLDSFWTISTIPS